MVQPPKQKLAYMHLREKYNKILWISSFVDVYFTYAKGNYTFANLQSAGKKTSTVTCRLKSSFLFLPKEVNALSLENYLPIDRRLETVCINKFTFKPRNKMYLNSQGQIYNMFEEPHMTSQVAG